MLESLGLNPANDFATLETLGNTGAAALPVTMALGIEQGLLRPGDRVAMLGIGSGINCQMLAVEWQKSMAELRQEIGGQQPQRSIARLVTSRRLTNSSTTIENHQRRRRPIAPTAPTAGPGWAARSWAAGAD